MPASVSHETRSFSAPLDGAVSGRLSVTGGMTNITLSSEPMDVLFRATFRGRVPAVHTSRGRVEIEFPRRDLLSALFARDRELTEARIVLNPDIAWAVVLHGGASRLRADLRDVVVDRLELHGGANRASIELGQPAGTTPIAVHGGVAHLDFQRPAGVPVRVRLAGGLSQFQLDGQHISAIAGRSDMQSPAYDEARDRYSVELHGGVSHLAVTELSRSRSREYATYL